MPSDHWRIDALCSHHDEPEIFIADPGTLQASAAKEVCGECTVRAQCFEYGLFEIIGIYGGFDAEERATIVTFLRLVAPRPPCTICGQSLEEENRPGATRHDECAARVERAKRIRADQAAPGRCPKCRAEMSSGISKCGACTWSPRSRTNSLPY